MKFRFTISWKLGLGFGILSLAFIINSWFIARYLQKSRNLNKSIIEIYEPSVRNLEKLYDLVIESKLLLKNWILIEEQDITPDNLRLLYINDIQIPFLQKQLLTLSENWDQYEKQEFDAIRFNINDTFLVIQSNITNFLKNPNSYKDKIQKAKYLKQIYSEREFSVISDKISLQLIYLLDKEQKNVFRTRADMNISFNYAIRLIGITSIILIILAFIIAFLTIRSFVTPIDTIRRILISMSKGILPDYKIKEGKDEIGEMSKALNSLVKGLKDTSDFSLEIGKGNFNSEFEPLSEHDNLGNSLIKMRQELRNAVLEESKRKLEDTQRNWATQGIAKFGEILRQNNNDVSDLSLNVISNLVNYLNANQGGLFIVNNSDPDNIVLELKGCYAYNRQKFIEKTIAKGEGLLGRCFQECETIYLTDIPENYIKISSGIGEDNPRSLLIVPLMVNDEVYGVIEIASFNHIESYQIDFVEKIGGSIASTISTVQINMQTTKLLEQSRNQAENMASQEEEMRQNMEELRATQEQSARKEAKLLKELAELKEKLKEKGI
jgi:methyl-accepting chemotaxis protein